MAAPVKSKPSAARSRTASKNEPKRDERCARRAISPSLPSSTLAAVTRTAATTGAWAARAAAAASATANAAIVTWFGVIEGKTPSSTGVTKRCETARLRRVATAPSSALPVLRNRYRLPRR